jgi:hypothetical protein
MAGAMNLTEVQRDALSTLAVGTAVVRLADEHPEPFLIKVPRCSIREGAVDDAMVRQHMRTDSTESVLDLASFPDPPAITPVPIPDKNNKSKNTETSHPPSPPESITRTRTFTDKAPDLHQHPASTDPPILPLSREEMRFISDVAAHPLSTTVSRYQRLHLSRRKGNAIRQSLLSAGLIESVPIATRSGQVVLYDLTDHGRSIADANGINSGSPPRAGVEHRYWVARVAEHFERQGYDVTHEFHITDDGHVDLVAEKPNERLAIEVETGKSDIKANLEKLQGAGFDRIVLLATGPSAIASCQRALETQDLDTQSSIEIRSWLDF